MYCSHFPCYRCVTTVDILLQVIVDSVAGGDDSDGSIKYILHQRIFCFDGGGGGGGGGGECHLPRMRI